MRIQFAVMVAFILQGLKYWGVHPEKLYKLIEALLHGGVKYVRILLFYPFQPVEEWKDSCIRAPWQIKKGKYDLTTFDKKYWKQFEAFLRLLNRAGIVPIISVLEFAESHFNREFAPYFRGNLQRIDAIEDLWKNNGKKFLKLIKPTFRQTVKIAKKACGENFYIELGNEWNYEPTKDLSSARSYLQPLAKYLQSIGVPLEKIIVPHGEASYYHNIWEVSKGSSKTNHPEFPFVIADWHFGDLTGLKKQFSKSSWKWWFQEYTRFMFSTDGAYRGRHTIEQEQKLFSTLIDWIAENTNVRKKELLIETQPIIVWEDKKINKECGAVLGHNFDKLTPDYFLRVFPVDLRHEWARKLQAEADMPQEINEEVVKEEIDIFSKEIKKIWGIKDPTPPAQEKSWLQRLIEWVLRVLRKLLS